MAWRAWMAFAAIALGATAARADEPDAGVAEPLQFHAWVDAYGAFNANRPSSRANFEPGTGTSGKRANELALNDAAIDVSVDPKPVGLHITLADGEAMSVLRANEPHGDAIGPGVWQHLYQATLAYQAPLGRGLLLQAGVFPCHAGFESFFPEDDWNYTRGWLGELSPYYQAGLMLAYAFTDHLSAQLHLLNGWSVIGDNNRGKTLGTQLAWNDARLSLSFNTLVGPELADDDTHYRYFGDLVGVLRPSSAFAAAVELDAGLQERPAADAAHWQGVSLWLRAQPRPYASLTLRGEVFRDPDAVVAGVGQSLQEGTATFELRPAAPLGVRLEARYDHASAPLFDAAPGPRDHQLLFLLAALVKL